MDTVKAFARAEASRGGRVRVFDWNKAARRIIESGAREASAGLQDDWEWTGGRIWADGPETRSASYTYLASTWAIPELDLDGDLEPCWTWADETNGWDAQTFWPESARSILLGRAS